MDGQKQIPDQPNEMACRCSRETQTTIIIHSNVPGAVEAIVSQKKKCTNYESPDKKLNKIGETS